MPDHSFSEAAFPHIQSKPPLVQPEAISSCPAACYQRKESNPHFTTTSFQVLVESKKVPSELPFLHTKQPQLPQLLLIGLVLQTFHQLHCLSLDMLQHLNVLLGVRGPKLQDLRHDITSAQSTGGQSMPWFFLDFSKAFDTVPQSILLWDKQVHGALGEKLAERKSSKDSNEWSYIYLAGNWHQLRDTIGIPCGSTPQPVLFSIFINHVDAGVECTISKFADGTKLEVLLTLEGQEALERFLHRLEHWTTINGVKFSKLKCQILHLGWNNIQHKYILGEWLESSLADRDLIASSVGVSSVPWHPGMHQTQHHQLVSGEEGAELLSLVSSDRTCGNGSKLHQGRFSPDIRKHLLAGGWSNTGTNFLERWSMPQA